MSEALMMRDDRGPKPDDRGRAFAAQLGIDSPPMLWSRTLRRSQLAVTRLRRDTRRSETLASLPPENAWAVQLQLRACANRRLWVDGKPAPSDPYPAGASCLYDSRRSLVGDASFPFDVVRFHLPGAALDELTDEVGARRITSLQFRHGVPADDAVIRSLGLSLLPAIDRPGEANGLFVDHVANAFRAHVAQAYGGMRAGRQPVRGGLAPWQERRAKDLIEANLDGEMSLVDVARDCGLSPSYFARAFRQSTGMPPHRWLLQRRVVKARELMTET